MGWLKRSTSRVQQSSAADLASEADIPRAYRLILRREPDESGLAHYRKRVRQGLSLRDLIATLLESDEYKERASRVTDSEKTDHTAVTEPRHGEAESEPARTALIDPKDVIRRYTVEELNTTAEEYYRRVDDPTPLMSKPFTFLHEAPEMLQNLGFLLSGLHLGKTMTILDFGGGTGWLSRFLVQLNCRPICCDVSQTALDIGRRLFKEHPAIGPTVFQPTFLFFDGHRLDLPDQSVDRIVTFDAFHHVPNSGEILAEFGRVLKPGGIAGFSEPGRWHSRSPQAQYEMRNHRVLENDIDLNELFSAARDQGFTSLSVKVLNDMELPLDAYNLILDAESINVVRSEIWANLINTMSQRSVFFLHKGPLRRDSRSHVGLAHVLRTDKTEFMVPQGRGLRLTFSITNTGDAEWLNTNDEIFGIVRLASHLYDAEGNLLEVDHSRHDLPAPVKPGDAIEMTVDVPLPPSGSCRLAFDLVAEGVMWFENVGSTPIYVTVRRTVT